MASQPQLAITIDDYIGHRDTLKLYEVAAVLGLHKVTHSTLHRMGIPHVHTTGPHEPHEVNDVRGALVSVRALKAWLDRGGDAA